MPALDRSMRTPRITSGMPASNFLSDMASIPNKHRTSLYNAHQSRPRAPKKHTPLPSKDAHGMNIIPIPVHREEVVHKPPNCPDGAQKELSQPKCRKGSPSCAGLEQKRASAYLSTGR